MIRYWRVLALAFVLLAVGAFQLYGIFSNEGYEPEQPIKYSHVLHAGVMKMECLYCHYTAEDSQHAAVPSVDVCMGCHSIVQTQSPEIQKLAEYYNSDKPVPWKRIHKTPDHAWFSHKWHIEAGVSCQTCHGPIEQMPVVGQWRKLEMGACMECHRQDTYVAQVDHPPTWSGDTSMEKLEGATGGLVEAVDKEEEMGEEQWASVMQEFQKYHDGTGADAEMLKKKLQAYRENRYLSGWNYQVRGMNASIECSTCHQ